MSCAARAGTGRKSKRKEVMPRLGMAIGLFASTVLVLYVEAAGQARGARSLARPVQSSLEAAAARMDAHLTELDLEYEGFLADPWLGLGKSHFGAAQLAAMQLVKEGVVDPHAVNRFHNSLDEFVRALDSLDGYRPNTSGQAAALREVKKPSLKAAKDLAADLRKLKAEANAVPGLREVALVELKSGSSAEEAVLYTNLVIDKIDVIIYSRGLGQITWDGRRRTHEEFGVHLHALRVAINGMVDESGARVPQLDPSGQTKLRDQLAPVKRALDEVDKMARIFRKNFSHAEDRIQMAQAELANLRKNILRPKDLQE